MCLIVFSWKEHPDFPLILAANRDEFHDRPALQAHYWEDYPDLLAGKDMAAGGTWMGITRKGRLAMLTNYRDIPSLKKDAPTRGHLVSDFLQVGESAESYLNMLLPLDFTYNGYNLIAGDLNGLYYHSNFASGVHPVEPGIHVLSNHLLNTPWPKAVRAKEKFTSIISGKRFTIGDLTNMMFDHERPPDELLPETGVGIERERMLSPMFITGEGYGSRCTTVIMVDKSGNVRFRERTYHLEDFTFKEKNFRFSIK